MMARAPGVTLSGGPWVCIHQVEEVCRIRVEPLARDDLPPSHLFYVAPESWAFVLQGAHGCFMRPRAVSVTAVILYGHTFWVCPLGGECPFCRGCSTAGHVRRVARGYCVKPGGEPCLLVSGGCGGGGVIAGGDEVQ